MSSAQKYPESYWHGIDEADEALGRRRWRHVLTGHNRADLEMLERAAVSRLHLELLAITDVEQRLAGLRVGDRLELENQPQPPRRRLDGRTLIVPWRHGRGRVRCAVSRVEARRVFKALTFDAKRQVVPIPD